MCKYVHCTILRQCCSFLIPIQCWNFRTIYGGQEPSRNRIVVPARQATQAGGIDSLESIPGLLYSLKIPVQMNCTLQPNSQSLSGGGGIRIKSTLCRSQLYSPVKDYEFGYCSLSQNSNTAQIPQFRLVFTMFRHIYFVKGSIKTHFLN